MYDRGWKFGQLHWSEILGIRLREKRNCYLLEMLQLRIFIRVDQRLLLLRSRYSKRKTLLHIVTFIPEAKKSVFVGYKLR